MFVVQSNIATFGYPAEREQQLALSRLRAVERGRTVAVAVTIAGRVGAWPERC